MNLFNKSFRIVILLFLTFQAVNSSAQNIGVSYNSVALPNGSFTVCGAAQTNSLKITNNESNTISSFVFTMRIPDGGLYEPGSITGAIETDISNLNQPKFQILGNILSNNGANDVAKDISYALRYTCPVIAFQNGGGITREILDVSYVLSGNTVLSNGLTPSTTYNVLAASLSIINATNSNFTGSVGNTFPQQLTIRNGGLGCTSSAFVKLDNAGGTFSFSSPSVGTLQNDTLFFSAADMPGGDGLWCNAEDVIVSYTVAINNCTNLNRSTVAAWGCDGAACGVSSVQPSNVILTNNAPNLQISTINPNYDYCFTGDTKKQTIRITNTGTGPATNIQIRQQNSYPASYSGLNFFDTTMVWQIRNSSGIAIGAIKDFEPISAEHGFGDAVCSPITRFREVAGYMKGLILAPGDYVEYDLWSTASNLKCGGCYDGLGWLAIRTQADYKNQCKQGNYNTGYVGSVSRAYAYFTPSITAPIDVVGGQSFTLDAYYSGFSVINHPSGNGLTYIAMPLAGTGFVVDGTSVSISSYTFPLFTQNDTLFIGPISQNINTGGEMKIPLKATCGSPGTKNLSLFVLNQYDKTCSPVNKMGCRSLSINLHCPTACVKGGANPVSFALRRVSYGLPDNNNDGIPDVSGIIDLSKIKNKNSVNGDTLMGTWNIKVEPNVDPLDPNVGQNFNYLYVDFDMNDTDSPGTVSSIPNASVEIFPAGGGAPFLCTVSPTIWGRKAHYDFSACKSTWIGGDSLVFKALFSVNQYNGDRYNEANNANFDLFVTNNEVYTTYTPQLTATTAPINGQTYTCNHFNDFNQISRIWLSPYIPAPQTIEGCQNSLISYMRQYTRAQEGAGIFPYEYRNFWIIDTMMAEIPTGFVYRSNSANFDGAPIMDSNVLQVGNKLFFINLKNFYTKFGGTRIPQDEINENYVAFSIDATSTAVSGTYTNSNNASGVGNGVNTPTLNYGLYHNAKNSGNATGNGWIYYAPQPNLAGGGSVITNTGKAEWSIQLQNLANNADASNSFFYVAPVNSLSNIKIFEQPGNTPKLPDANGFYQLGTLSRSANRNFTIKADLKNCNVDSLKINFGYNCTGYPNTFVPVPNQKALWLKAAGYPASLDYTFEKSPSTGSVTLCAPLSMEAVINSTLVGNLESETLKVKLPTGMTYVPNSVQVAYPSSASILPNAYNPTQSNDTLFFAINNLTGGTGLTGIEDLTKNNVRLKFDLETKCGFTSGASIKSIISGKSVCGTAVPQIRKQSSGIKLTGANPVTQFSIRLIHPDTFATCKAIPTVTVVVKNTGSNPASPLDSIKVNISDIFTYVPNSYQVIYNSATGLEPIIADKMLTWPVTSNLASGDSMKFTIKLAPNLDACGDASLEAKIIEKINLDCNGSNCQTPVVVGSYSDDNVQILCCCLVNSITALPGTCNTANNKYTLTGAVTFTFPPTTGTLTVKINNGASQVFNAPFTSPTNYTVTGLSDGATHTVTAQYSADATCQATNTYVSPQNCCPEIFISNASTSYCIGSGSSPANDIVVQTTIDAINSITFTKFENDQIANNATPTNIELANVYTTGANIATVTPTGTSPYTATYTFNAADFPNTGTTPKTYYVYAILSNDASGNCRPMQEITVVVNPLPTFELESTNISCYNAANGTITIKNVTGTSPFQYSKDDGNTFEIAIPTNSKLFNNLTPAPYKPTVKDANGCVRKCN
jgi:hypothetical protein